MRDILGLMISVVAYCATAPLDIFLRNAAALIFHSWVRDGARYVRRLHMFGMVFGLITFMLIDG